MPLCLVNTLFPWFSNLSGVVMWNNVFSNNFVINSGVPQGSINGPKFFNCIMDKILCTLELNHLGCYVNNNFAGAIAYADDLLLLSASLTTLQNMLDVCCNIGILFDLVFNPTKTVCGVFGLCSTSGLANLNLGDISIHWSDKMLYLGITFLFGVNLHVDISNRINKFHSSLSAVLKNKLIGFESVYVKLLLCKCFPILFYGLNSLSVNCNIVLALSKAWNMAFRWIYGLRKFDSTRLLLKSCGTMSAKCFLARSRLLFFNSVSVSPVLLLHSVYIWFNKSNTYRKLVNEFNMYDVCSRDLIYEAVSGFFANYCNELLEI
jgi:hypothetical protein